MSRAVVAGVLGVALALGGCGGKAAPYGAAPACPLLADLAQTGQTVARADVSDPAVFDATMRDATKAYVKTATKLRDAVPANLKGDVEAMIAAAQQRRFSDAVTARSRIDAYARGKCNLPDSSG
jgi:hypothetical protein